MAFIKVFVDSPAVLNARMASIANDGNDYEITFAAGLYVVSNLQINVNHSAGGKLIILPHAGGRVRFTAAPPSLAPVVNFTGRDISVHGMELPDIPYFGGALDSIGAVLTIGGRAGDGSYICDPTTLTITDCLVTGFGGIVAFGSSNPGVYTLERILNCRTSDTARNSSYTLTGANLGGNHYTNAYIDNLVGNGKNGPDSLVADPVHGVASSSYSGGTAAWEASDFAGSSTLLVTRNIHLSTILGSFNHDMHCFRLGFLNSPDVRITMRDCQWTGRWEAGKATGDGGGNMWLGYYHDGGPVYLTSAPRPRVDFENCTFDSTILPAVTNTPASMQDLLSSFNTQCDTDYHFWDSRFLWTFPAPFSPYVRALTFGSANVRIYLHNTTTNAPAVSNTPSGAQLLTTDAATLDNPGAIHGRVPAYV